MSESCATCRADRLRDDKLNDRDTGEPWLDGGIVQESRRRIRRQPRQQQPIPYFLSTVAGDLAKPVRIPVANELLRSSMAQEPDEVPVKLLVHLSALRQLQRELSLTCEPRARRSRHERAKLGRSNPVRQPARADHDNTPVRALRQSASQIPAHLVCALEPGQGGCIAV